MEQTDIENKRSESEMKEEEKKVEGDHEEE